MSCITKLLEMKGEKDFIPSPMAPGVIIEGGGTYKGYEYLVILNDMSFRCGYVAIPKSHKFYDTKKEDSYYCEYDVHGGVTFFSKPHLLESTCDDKWIGFDAGHLYDARDLHAAKKYFGEKNETIKFIEEKEMDHIFSGEFSTVKTYEYMESECKRLIEQLAVA